MKILVVDDEPIFLDLMVHTLKSIGYHDADQALQAQAALEKIDSARVPYTCFLLDIRMPGIDGIELCRRIRSRPEHSHTPIVMVTALTEKCFIDEAFLAGANDYVTKPIDAIEMKARMGMVEMLLDERQRSSLAKKQLMDAEEQIGRRMRFEEPISLPDASWVLPYSSLENYVLRLGNLRLFTTRSYGFHVTNAGEIFRQSEGFEFSDALAEVSAAISSVIGSGLLAYAGAGDFCVLLPKSRPLDRDHVEMQINDLLESAFEEGKIPTNILPRVRVGKAQSNLPLSFKEPTEILVRAILSARGTSREFLNARDLALG